MRAVCLRRLSQTERGGTGNGGRNGGERGTVTNYPICGDRSGLPRKGGNWLLSLVLLVLVPRSLVLQHRDIDPNDLPGLLANP